VLIMSSLRLLGPLQSYSGRIGAFGVGGGSCMTDLWHIVWFRRDWYRPVEYDASNQLVLHFRASILLAACTSAGAERAKRRRDSTACVGR